MSERPPVKYIYSFFFQKYQASSVTNGFALDFHIAGSLLGFLVIHCLTVINFYGTLLAKNYWAMLPRLNPQMKWTIYGTAAVVILLCSFVLRRSRKVHPWFNAAEQIPFSDARNVANRYFLFSFTLFALSFASLFLVP